MKGYILIPHGEDVQSFLKRVKATEILFDKKLAETAATFWEPRLRELGKTQVIEIELVIK